MADPAPAPSPVHVVTTATAVFGLAGAVVGFATGAIACLQWVHRMHRKRAIG